MTDLSEKAGVPGKSGWFGPPKGTHFGQADRLNAQYFEEGPGLEIIEDLSEEHKKQVILELTHKNVSVGQVEGLKKVTTEPPEDRPDWKIPAGSSPTGKEAVAAGFYRNNVLHINPETVNFGFTFSHEFGHHVTLTSGWRKTDRGSAGARILLEKFHSGEARPSSMFMAAMGLRSHSFTNDKEFMADCWQVYHRARRVQRNDLAEYLGVSDLSEVFGS